MQQDGSISQAVSTTQTTPLAPQSQIVYASLWRRFFAQWLDQIIIVVVLFLFRLISLLFLPIFALVKSDLLFEGLVVVGGLIELFIFLGYFIYFVGISGQTPGKKLLKIKVVRIDGMSPVGYKKAFLREFLGKVFIDLGVIGNLWALWDSKKQTWHDKIAKTIVIKV